MALEAGQIFSQINPMLTKLAGMLYLIGQILLMTLGVVYFISLFRFNVKVEVMEYVKGKRAVIRIQRATEVFDKKNNKPLLMFWSPFIFWGKKINIPSAECIFPLKSTTAKKMYKFVLKDGIYHPVQNYILGKNPISVTEVDGKIIQLTPQEVEQIEKDGSRIITNIYSGIEVNRDFDVEEAIANKLERDAVKYKNKKPVELVAMYGLMAIVIISSAVIIVYSLKRVGDLFVTLQTLSGPIEHAVQSAVTQKLGPG